MAAATPTPGSRPRRRVRMLLLVLLGLVGFVGLLLVMLPYLVSLERVKAPIVARLEALLQRQVDVGAVRLQTLSGLGVGLEDLIIYNPPGWQQPYFIKADTLSVKVAWWPLLRRQVEITKVLLRDGEVVIERDAQGRMNFSALTAPKPAAPRVLPTSAARPPDGAGAASDSHLLSRFLVSEAALQNMKVTFVDRKIVPGQATTTTASDVQLTMSDIALGTPLPVAVAATLLTDKSQNIRMRGTVGPLPSSLAFDSVPINVGIQATDVLLNALGPYLGAAFPLVQGRLGADLNLQGSLDHGVRLSGTLSLADAMAREGVVQKAAAPLPTLKSAYDIGLDLAKERAELTDVQINLSSLQATIRGAVDQLMRTPYLDLQISTNTFAPGDLLAQIPFLGASLPAPTDLHGTVQLQAALKGTARNSRSDAQVDFKEVTLRSGSLNGGTPDAGGVLLETDRAQAALTMYMVPPQPPSIRMDVRVKRAGLDYQAAPPAAPTTSPEPTSPGPTPEAPRGKPRLPPVTLHGKVHIAEGRIQRAKAQEITAEFSLVDGKLASSQQMQVYAGSYQGTTKVDLTRPEPDYALDAKVVHLDVGRALDELTPAKKTLRGSLSTDLHLVGRGWTWDVINQTLSGQGHATIDEAHLATLDLIPELVQLLQNLAGRAGLTIDTRLDRDAFKTIEADWDLRHGRILTERLRLRGEGVEAWLDGSVGLDQSLEYAGKVFLPPKFMALRGRPSLIPQDDRGRFILPFMVKGTLQAPQVSLDEKALVGGVKEELIDKVRKRFGDRLEGLFGTPPAPEQERQESDRPSQESGDRPKRPQGARRLLEELLKR
jgi:AsmA-like C-terminal region/AsmA family